jgi:hypothetical protein
MRPMRNIERRHVHAFAHIVLAAVNEVTLMIAGADNPVAEFLDRLANTKPAHAVLAGGVQPSRQRSQC